MRSISIHFIIWRLQIYKELFQKLIVQKTPGVHIPGVYSEFSIDNPLKIKGRSKQGHEIDFFFYRVHFKRRDSLFIRNVIITL